MKFLVLDGNSIFSRAFYGIKMLSNKNGQMTNGIYGFLTTLNKLLSEVNPDRIAVAFDLPVPTFRHKMFEGYKGTRSKQPDEFISQLPILKDLLTAMGYKLVTYAGYEADDILGTFASFCEKNDYECVLATGDRDILQLISSKVCVRIASTKFGRPESTLYDTEKVKEEYGVSPEHLVDIKALQGDTSDNIPGVKGIGKKTASDLVSRFGSIEEIYKNIEFIDIKPSVKEKLIEGKEMAELSYALGKIDTSVPIEINEQDFIPKKMDEPSVKKIMTELEFFKLLEKMNFSEVSENISSKEVSCEELLKILKNEKSVSFLPFIESFEIKKMFFGVGKDVYALSHDDENFESTIRKIMVSDDIEKISHNLKLTEKVFEKNSVEISDNHFDVMLASYVLTPSEKDYEVFKLGSAHEISIPQVALNESLKPFEKIIQQVYVISKLEPILKKEIKANNQSELLTKIEQPLSKVLASMENIGFLVDRQGLEKYGDEIETELKKIEASIHSLAGEEFNVNSPRQLGSILFEKLKLPYGKKGKTGYSTSAQILEKLSGEHKIVDEILKYRSLSKLKSTYCDGIIKLIQSDGRVRSSFNQTETRTGRISSSEPNLQNIPVRTEKGRQLRKFFKAPEGCVLIDADYSQIELRVLAHVSQDKNMINAFKNGEDIHAITASQIMGVPLEMVTPEMRFKAKAVNFGILYGMSAFSLAKDLEISFEEAQTYIVRYLAHYEGIDNYMRQVIEKAREQGYVETIFSRRRYLPEIHSTNFVLRSFGERVARNMPIQGAAADIIKIAMINVFEKLKNEKSKLILQVHDELIIEAKLSEAERVKKMLQNEMENAVKLSVPLEVNISMGATWYDAKD